MIVGVDHLALSVTDINTAKKDLERDGYVCSFIEMNVPNAPAKKRLLSHYQPTHDIGYFKSCDSTTIPIEAINHGNVTSVTSPFVCHKNFIELRVGDVQAEKKFWVSFFSFEEIDTDTLSYYSLILNFSLTIKVVSKIENKLHTLDSQGYPCIAFFSNDLDSDMRMAKSLGAEDLTQSFDLVINNKVIRVAMFRTPGGAICELIQMSK